MAGDNFPGERIESLVDELEGLIEEARPPFGKNQQFKVIETEVGADYAKTAQSVLDRILAKRSVQAK